MYGLVTNATSSGWVSFRSLTSACHSLTVTVTAKSQRRWLEEDVRLLLHIKCSLKLLRAWTFILRYSLFHYMFRFGMTYFTLPLAGLGWTGGTTVWMGMSHIYTSFKLKYLSVYYITVPLLLSCLSSQLRLLDWDLASTVYAHFPVHMFISSLLHGEIPPLSSPRINSEICAKLRKVQSDQ